MYTESVDRYLMPRGTTPLAIEAVDAAIAVHGGYVVFQRCRLTRIMFALEIVVAADTTAPAVEFNRRPTIASAAGELLLGTLTIPDATAAGTVIYKDITPAILEVGDELSLEHTVQGADAGTATGDGYYGWRLSDCPEDPRSEDNMTASA